MATETLFVWRLLLLLSPLIIIGSGTLLVTLGTILFGETVQKGRVWITRSVIFFFAIVMLLEDVIIVSVDFSWAVIIAIAIGVVLYYVDLVIISVLVDYPTLSPERPLKVLPKLVVPIPEEVIFRAGFVSVFPDLQASSLIILSSILFGLSHAGAGKREVALKSGNGIVYMSLFLFSGSILLPLLAHITYNIAYSCLRLGITLPGVEIED